MNEVTFHPGSPERALDIVKVAMCVSGEPGYEKYAPDMNDPIKKS